MLAEAEGPVGMRRVGVHERRVHLAGRAGEPVAFRRGVEQPVLELADVEHALLHVHERGLKGNGPAAGGLKGIAVGCGGQGGTVENHEAVAHGKEDVRTGSCDGSAVPTIKRSVGQAHLVAPHFAALAHLEDGRGLAVGHVSAEQPCFLVVQIEEILGHEAVVDVGNLEVARGLAVEGLAGSAHAMALGEYGGEGHRGACDRSASADGNLRGRGHGGVLHGNAPPGIDGKSVGYGSPTLPLSRFQCEGCALPGCSLREGNQTDVHLRLSPNSYQCALQ